MVLSRSSRVVVIRSGWKRHSQIYQEIFSEGEERGKAEGKAEVAIKLLKLGMAIAQIAEVTGLSIEQVLHLQWEEPGAEAAGGD
jgi:predicted transposase/invertase (TIGR01784 family)